MSLRLKKTLSFIFIGLLLFFVTQLASGVYSHDDKIDFTELTEYEYGKSSFKTNAILKEYSDQDKLCVRCHYRKSDLVTADGHARLNCTDCHTELVELTEYRKHETDLPSAVKSCLDCHENYDKNHDMIHKNVDFSQNEYEKPGCLDCHNQHETDNAKAFNDTINKCTKCHDEVYTDFTMSKHFAALRERNGHAPNCLKCHNHKTAMNKEKTLILCAKCHLDLEVFSEKEIKIVSGYFTEFHGRQALGNLQDGNPIDTLECKDCHDIHNANDLNFNQNRDCCMRTNCHDGVSENFYKAMTPHGRSNIKSDSNFAAWFFNLLGKIILIATLFLTLLDNLISTIRFKPDIKKSRSELNES